MLVFYYQTKKWTAIFERCCRCFRLFIDFEKKENKNYLNHLTERRKKWLKTQLSLKKGLLTQNAL